MSQPLEFQTNGKSIKAIQNCQANKYIEIEIKMMVGKTFTYLLVFSFCIMYVIYTYLRKNLFLTS